jgi:hypothetical protein
MCNSLKDLYSQVQGLTVTCLKKSTFMRVQLILGPITAQNQATPGLFKGGTRTTQHSNILGERAS